MEISKHQYIVIALIAVVLLAAGCVFAIYGSHYFVKQADAVSSGQKNILSANKTASQMPVILPPQKLSNPPAIINAVYVTGYSAGTASYQNYLTSLFKNTEVNAVVVDIKESNGNITYASGALEVQKYHLDNDVIPNIDDLVRFLHSQNIYVIGRIPVFEDSAYATAHPEWAVYDKSKTTDAAHPVLWKNADGISWMDPASQDVWAYNLSLAKDVFAHGFDEVNFDYVRFPTDGNAGNMGFPVWDTKTPMADVIKTFFHYLRTNLPNEKISADLFGLTTVDTDDMGIGQVIENAFENFDFVAPMTYPSLYADGFIGFANPAEHPYDVITYSLDHAVARQTMFIKNAETQAALQNQSADSSAPPTPSIPPIAKFRPWLQDFNLGADYTAPLVEQEIKAVQDSLGGNYAGFMLWNPSNIYTQAAIVKPN